MSEDRGKRVVSERALWQTQKCNYLTQNTGITEHEDRCDTPREKSSGYLLRGYETDSNKQPSGISKEATT